VSLTATYNGDLSRVALDADTLGASATYAVVERSLNEQLWLPVRGGLTLPVESQEAEVSDYEFFADVQNFYRITSYDASDVQQEQFTDDLTPSLSGQVWMKSIKYPPLNRPVRVLDRGEPIARASRSMASDVVGRSVPVGTHELHTGQQFELRIITTTDHATQAGAFDIIFGVGGSWFVHTPAGSAVPGGYVMIGQVTQERLYRADPNAPRVFTLPCTVEAPPGPQITGSLLVAETLFRLYGDANALYAAHSTGRSLLATIGDPGDLVVV
jgi:hypothetical protein